MQELKLKRIIKKGDIPHESNIRLITTLYINKQSFQMFISDKDKIYFYNRDNGKWQVLVNEIS